MNNKSAFRRGVKDSQNPYLMIRKDPLNDTGLSWKAKGILAYLLSLPDDWKIYEVDLVKRSKDGRDSLRSGIQELIDAGYIERYRSRTDSGKFGGYEYVVWETLKDRPEGKNRYGKSHVGKSHVGKSHVGKPDTTNNKDTNNKDTNNKDTNNKDTIPDNIYIDNSKEKESQITEEEKKIQSIYEEWKKANIINHRRITRAMKTKIKSALKDYTEEEIKQSIRNYSYIVNNDNYFFSHRWTLDQFCTITQKDRIGNFLDLEVAKNNYRANKGDIGNGGNERHNIKNEDDSRKEYEEFEAEYFEKWKI